MKHKTSLEHYEEYAGITGGTARPILRQIVMDMIGNDIEALKQAYIEDKHLNNIDKVLDKAGTRKHWGSILDNKNHMKNKKAFKDDFKSRCTKLGLSSGLVKLLEGPYCSRWFLSFDYYAPEFTRATMENRKMMKEKNPKKSYGISNSCICSGLKHVMIFDVLGCEFEEEIRN
ncbi:MAG: hypothetical protein HRU18_01145 [Pseudoalteromonas sp.]|uniref:hypothetical protein n=1 Tax=Pseudoalteromonas sp. TaxID=53249 RepID=UPI001DADA99C|nr:hypothetical protein [Pseudoalteromonas sp.]NRA76785.1 hypothetical protein [Pseudoalteromonas sp.]